MSNKDELSNIFQKLPREKQKELLANVCLNMLYNQDWNNIADLIITQLGENDAMEVIIMYAKSS